MKPDPLDTPPRRVRTAKAKFTDVVVACSKCAKRQGLPKRALRALVKGAMKRTHSGRKLRIVETGCLGPCPKHRLAVVTGASAMQGRILLIDPSASPEDMLAALLPERPEAALTRASKIGDGAGAAA